ncbi:MAG: ABC transporter permease [Planctomycetes bacterium]|nr:ABC transporter permease [Planctomycetota bacterium]
MPESAPSWLSLCRARFFARPFARLATTTLFLLVGLAVFAPLIANDRPLYLRAVDRGGFESARRSLAVIVFAVERELVAAPRDADALERELGALELRARRLGPPASPAFAAELDAMVAKARAFAAGAATSATELDAWRTDATELAVRLAPRDASHDGIELVAQTTFPAFATLSPLDGLAMGAWGALFVGGLARLATRRRLSIRAVLLGATAAAALAATAAWLGADASTPPGSAQKRAASSGELEVESALFAPIPFGFGETRLGEAHSPPSWWRSEEPVSAEADSDLGSRWDLAFDDSKWIEVLYGERELDDPWRHPFGTDSLGRDLVARCVWGARASLTIGIASAAAVALIGTLIGALAGHFRGWVDGVASRTIEVLQCVPSFFLAVLALSLVRVEGVQAALAVAAVIALFGWTQIARLVRAEFLRGAELDWVLAARSVGVSEKRLVFVHVLPNALSPAIVAAVFAVAGAILLESALSFLGVGLAEPVPSWGSVLGDASSAHEWWTVAFPGLFLFATLLAVHRAGEALREALDPRSEVR